MRSASLSVIVANFNNERYIEECLDSVIAQTFRPLEVIVCDDGSDDSSPAIVRRYERAHPGLVKGIFSRVNRGVSQARNEAILASGGEYISTLDSDDYYGDIRKLEKEMDLILGHRRDSASDVIAYSNILRVSEDGAPLQLMGRPGNMCEGRILREMITRAGMIPRDFVVRKSAYLESGGYDPGLRTHEDWDLKIRLAARWAYYCTNMTGTSYRQRPGGLASLPLATRTGNMWKVFFKNIHLVAPEEREAVTAEFTAFMARRQDGFDRSCLQE